MNRMKSFDVPHKALRNALSKISFLAGSTDYSSSHEIELLYNTGKEVFTILHVHAEDENDVPLAELEARCPGCSNHDTADHEIIEREQDKLEKLLAEIYEGSKSGADMSEAGAAFYLSFSEFHGKYLEHTAGEERVTQAMLWQYFSDEELAGFRQRIMAHLLPETLMIWLKYIVPAQSRRERIAFLSVFQKTAPPALFARGMQVIQPELSTEAFGALSKALEAAC